MPWIVELIKTPKVNDFRNGFFPRREYYKADAVRLQKEVIGKGGEVKIWNIKDWNDNHNG